MSNTKYRDYLITDRKSLEAQMFIGGDSLIVDGLVVIEEQGRRITLGTFDYYPSRCSYFAGHIKEHKLLMGSVQSEFAVQVGSNIVSDVFGLPGAFITKCTSRYLRPVRSRREKGVELAQIIVAVLDSKTYSATQTDSERGMIEFKGKVNVYLANELFKKLEGHFPSTLNEYAKCLRGTKPVTIVSFVAQGRKPKRS